MNCRIAICFFGITRSLSHTIGSIERNIIEPAREVGDVRLFAHFFNQSEIDNPRSGETGKLDTDEHKLLNLHWLKLEEPSTFIDDGWFNKVTEYGDEYNDDFRSIQNLIHQLHSLKQVGAAATSWGADIYIFVRPDIIYHDCFSKILSRAFRQKRSSIYLPSWAHWGPGYNDRFCVCVGDEAAHAYSERLLMVDEYCATHGQLHAEKLVKYALKRGKQKVRLFSVRGSRVRSNGKIVDENFTDFRIIRIKEYLLYPVRAARKFSKFLQNRYHNDHPS